jgi:tryptophan-rich sensory protein
MILDIQFYAAALARFLLRKGQIKATFILSCFFLHFVQFSIATGPANGRIDRRAGLSIVPYAVWITFAGYLF